MPDYVYKNATGEHVVITKPMAEAGNPEFDPATGEELKRVWIPPADIWKCDGAFKTDYFKENDYSGTRADWLRDNWEKTTGEKAPDPVKA